MSILPLPEDVRAQIKSSVEITCLADVVEGLLKNALDASSNNVSISVDFARGFCSVTDDGSGIPFSDFSHDCNLARLHCTSKLESQSYGSQGRFLFYLSSLSLLSIASRQRDESTISTAVLQHGSIISRHNSIGNEELGRNGTKVIVHNLFGNIPVRFKQQAARSSDPTDVERQFEALKLLLVSYLLAFAKPINLRLFSNDQSLKCHWGLSLRSINSVASRLEVGFCKSWGNLYTLRHMHYNLSLKKSQFVSFGQYPVSPRGFASIIYDEINALFDSSAFGAIENGGDSPSSRPSSRKNPDLRQASMRTRVVKGVDRWPAFYIRIESNSSAVLANRVPTDSTNDRLPSALQDVVALVKLLIIQFLETHQFRPKRSRTPRRYHPARAGTQQTLGERSPYNGWKRIKSGFPVTQHDLCSGLPFADQTPRNVPALDDDVRLFLEDLEIESESRDDYRPNAELMGNHAQHTSTLGGYTQASTGGGESVTWTNPRTGKVLHLNASNGCVTVPKANAQIPDNPTEESRPSSASMSRRLLARHCTRGELAERVWKWPSSTFPSLREPPIPSLVLDGAQEDKDNAGVPQKVEAASLAIAQVLRQVDDKFILTLLPTSASNLQFDSLVLIDQHAADERIKVEEFYQNLCSGHRVLLTRPIVFDVSDEEAKRFDRTQSYFATWAVDYHVTLRNTRSGNSGRQTSITVTHLPRIIAERCQLEPKILIEMLRREIWSKDPLLPSIAQRPGAPWTSRISQCPEGLLEMVKSRACRSAIMFNDILTNDQVQELLRSLSKCASPFQCAHGRLSTTVLASFGDGDTFGSQDQETESFGRAFKHWYR